jgi:hypothetical protein
MLNQISFMKITRILSLIAVMAVAFSCSKDDDAKPSLEEAAKSASQQNLIQVPTAMQNSQDPNAIEVASYVSMANLNFALLQVPAGATKSSTKITAANGRTRSSQETYLVYTWTDAQQGISVAYQVSESSDSYIFELFYKDSSRSDEWYRYLYGEQKKDRSAGFFNLIDIYGLLGDDQTAVFLKYQWTRSGDNFEFTFSDFSDSMKFTGTINTKTKAGELKLYEDTVVTYEASWTAQGTGSWKSYDSQGVLEDSGTW